MCATRATNRIYKKNNDKHPMIINHHETYV